MLMQNDVEEHSNAVEQLFWIDTLCVPCSSAGGAEEAKRAALAKMGEVYAQAAKVFLLD